MGVRLHKKNPAVTHALPFFAVAALSPLLSERKIFPSSKSVLFYVYYILSPRGTSN